MKVEIGRFNDPADKSKIHSLNEFPAFIAKNEWDRTFLYHVNCGQELVIEFDPRGIEVYTIGGDGQSTPCNTVEDICSELALTLITPLRTTDYLITAEWRD